MGGDLDRPQRGLSGLRKFCCFGPATIEPASADNGKILCAPGLFVKRCKCLFGAQKKPPRREVHVMRPKTGQPVPCAAYHADALGDGLP